MNTNNILVTGGFGILGRSLIKQLLINEQNDKIQTLVTKINDCNSKIDKIEEEWMEELASVNKEMDNMNNDIIKSMGSSRRKTKKKSKKKSR